MITRRSHKKSECQFCFNPWFCDASTKCAIYRYEGVCVGSKSIWVHVFFMPVVILDYGAIDCVEPFEVGVFFFPIKDALSIWTN